MEKTTEEIFAFLAEVGITPETYQAMTGMAQSDFIKNVKDLAFEASIMTLDPKKFLAEHHEPNDEIHRAVKAAIKNNISSKEQ